MKNKKKLQAMLESIINEDVDKASKHFHSYLSEMIAHETGMDYESDDEGEMSSDDDEGSSDEKSCDCDCDCDKGDDDGEMSSEEPSSDDEGMDYEKEEEM